MTVFYNGPGALITHEVFEAFGCGGERFPIAELTYVHVVELPAELTRSAMPWLRIANVLFAAAAVVVAVRAWHAVRDSEIVVAVLLVTSLTSLFASGCLRTPVEGYELRATFRGRSVCLLQTGNERALGEVCVGLLRAFGSAQSR